MTSFVEDEDATDGDDEPADYAENVAQDFTLSASHNPGAPGVYHDIGVTNRYSLSAYPEYPDCPRCSGHNKKNLRLKAIRPDGRQLFLW